MKKDQERLEKQLGETQAENRRLIDPLHKAREELSELQKQLSSYERDKISLRVSVEELDMQLVCQYAMLCVYSKGIACLNTFFYRMPRLD